MIKLRLTVGSGSPVQFPINDGEILDGAVTRALTEIPLGDFKKEEIFQVLVNGNNIPHEMWRIVKIKEADQVLIAPILKGDDPGSIFKQALIIAITVVASVYLTPAGGATIGSALAVAGVTIGASMLLNALIPPPVPHTGSLSGDSELSNSQMYSINSQSNATRKMGTVPKVYGQHKMFPIVAANPYAELEVDPGTGELAQYFYAVYDFGFGPLKVENIQIGDTPISDFSDVQYNLIDTRKPLTPEGPWDEVTTDKLQYYKGDVEVDAVAVVLEGNKLAGGPQDTWEATRNSAENIDGANQTISLTFLNPNGLYSFASNGVQGSRSILMDIYFALVGTDDWHAFNDLMYVDNFLGVGGDQAYQDFPMPAFPPANDGNGVYSLLTTGLPRNPDYNLWTTTDYPYPNRPRMIASYTFGYEAGEDEFIILGSSELAVGNDFKHAGTVLGKITNIDSYGPDDDYVVVKIDKPLTYPLYLTTYEGGLDYNQPTPVMRWRLFEDRSNLFSTVNRLLGKAHITRQDSGPVYSSFRFTPKNPGQYKIRVTRLSTTSPYTANFQDTLTWAQISTRFDRAPINTDKRHLLFELKIRATNQLNGAIANLSAVVTSPLDVYDPDTQTWSKQLTSNPAWVFVDLLTGEVNKRAIDKSRLHVDSIVEWAEFCDEVPTPPAGYDYTYGRFECNFILDFQTSLQGVLQQVGSAAQASLNIIDGKYGVLIDKLKTVPVQIFTPRNTKDFQSNRTYTRRPDGLKVKYIDPSVGWSVAETIVYDNGFDKTNAVEFDEMSSFGCTNQEQAWRFGRYMLAQNRLRLETISFNADFEHMVATRGDYVQITQDVMKSGGFPSRVKSVVGNRVVTDDAFDLPGGDYGFTYRANDGQIYTNTLSVVFSDTFDLDGANIPAVGDLIVVGIVDQLVFDCIIKSISPNDDLSASIVLVEKADAIYSAESTDTFPDYDPRISATTDQNVAPPGEVEELEVIASGWECLGSGYRYFVNLDWDVPTGSAFEFFSVLVNSGKGYTEVGQTRESQFSYTVDPTRLGLVHEFKVIAVSATGKKRDLGAVGFVSATPLSKTSAPSNVKSLSIDIVAETLQLTWEAVEDCDVSEYLIRFTPLKSGGSWEASIPLMRVDRNTTLASTNARTGTYLLKAVDFNGNESLAAVIAVTTIPDLFNLNVIEEISDFPALDGVFDKTEDEGSGTLVLQKSINGLPEEIEYFPEGFYYYSQLVDLGEIYTNVRLQSLIQAEGFTADDLMANWTSLDAVQFLANSRHSEWDVEAQYRATNQLNVMADWTALSDIDPIGGGDPDNFTEWRKFIMGDVTARILQFRLRLLQFKSSVTPRVFDGTIRVDMPDRREEYANLIATADDGYELAYLTPYKGPGTTPSVQISMEAAEPGDYWEFDYKSLAGFLIRFFDVNGTPVARTFDVAIAGYGREATNVI